MPARLLVSTGAAALALGALTPAAAWAESPHDPAGNNGTIKIQPYGGAGGHGNHPHPGCDFRLQLFGFDDDQSGTITFTGQAPTRGAVTEQPLSGTRLLSDDRAGGGNDTDAQFDVRGADLGLTGTPAAQGFHVKVQVDADGAPGGAKTKVFWLDCPAAAAPAQAGNQPVSGSDTGSGSAPATTTTTTTTPATSTQSTSTTSLQGATTGAATAPATTTRTATEDTELLATARSSAMRTGGGLATAVEEARTGSPLGSATAASTGRTGAPTGLPFTGLPAEALAGLGLAAIAAGGLAVAAGRRRTRSS